MSKSKVIIIEDEFFAANHIADLVRSLKYEISGIYHSGEEFLKQTEWDFDIAIIDIFLSKEMTGLQIASHLKERNKPFIFLTANQDSDTLQEAARLLPKAYISKPFKNNDVAAALEMMKYDLSPKIKIRGPHGVGYISVDDILFIKGDGVYLEIHTLTGMILQRKLLKEIEDDLPSSFIRIHRSFLINKNYIDQQSPNQLIIKGNNIPISRGYRDNIDL